MSAKPSFDFDSGPSEADPSYWLREEERNCRAILLPRIEIAALLRLADCRFLEINDAACAAYGFRAEEAIGRTPFDLNVLVEPDQFTKFVEAARRNSEVEKFELLTRRRNGELLPVLLSATTIEVDCVRCAVVTARDLSELKRAEEERNRALPAIRRPASLKSDLLIFVAHDLRTPLNVLLGSIDLATDLAAHGDAAALETIMRTSDRAARRLADTLEHLIDLLRLDSNSFDIRPELIRLHEFVDTELRDISFIWEPKPEVTVSFCDEAPDVSLTFDRHCLSKAFRILLHNAIKVTPHGEVRIRLFRDAAGRSCLEVSDSGNGIASLYLPHVFELSYSASPGTARQHNTTGLGLVVAKRFVDLNHAEILVDSQLGKGSIFTIRQEAPPSPDRDASTLV